MPSFATLASEYVYLEDFYSFHISMVSPGRTDYWYNHLDKSGGWRRGLLSQGVAEVLPCGGGPGRAELESVLYLNHSPEYLSMQRFVIPE